MFERRYWWWFFIIRFRYMSWSTGTADWRTGWWIGGFRFVIPWIKRRSFWKSGSEPIKTTLLRIQVVMEQKILQTLNEFCRMTILINAHDFSLMHPFLKRCEINSVPSFHNMQRENLREKDNAQLKSYHDFACANAL